MEELSAAGQFARGLAHGTQLRVKTPVYVDAYGLSTDQGRSTEVMAQWEGYGGLNPYKDNDLLEAGATVTMVGSYPYPRRGIAKGTVFIGVTRTRSDNSTYEVGHRISVEQLLGHFERYPSS